MRIFDLFCFKYNRTDFHELNLDWIISDLRTLAETLENFISLNTIKYANPIQWNIATQYGTNTVVVDANDGTAYLSVKPVPSGVAISNTDYWTPIFTLNFLSANQNITLRDDGQNILATFASAVNDWLIWQGLLYKVTQNININEAYVPGYNITRYTIEMFISDLKTSLLNMIGDISDLETIDKSNIVAAINECINKINDIQSNSIEWINVKSIGCDNTGNNDCSTIINNIISEGATELYFPEGTYLINDTITFNNSCEIHLDVKAKIITTRNVNVLFDILPTYGLEDYNDVFGYKRFILHGGIIDGAGNIETVFKIGYALNSHIVDCKIRGFTDYGIKIEHGAGNLIDNVQIYGEDANYGYYGNVDGVLRNVTVTDCHICFSSSFDSYERCSGWIAKSSLVPDSICFENRNHSVYSNCVSDTVQYAWVNASGTVALISNCSAINNDGVIVPTADFYLFYTREGSSSFYVNNFIVLLSAYTVTNTPDRPDRISIFNMTGTGGNLLPKNTLNGDLLSVITSGVNITSDIADNFTTTKAMLGYFTANAVNNTSAGWGIIICMRTHNPGGYLPQMFQFALVNNEMHTRFNDGSSWTSWS